MLNKLKLRGFTMIEILIALFVFSILSVILISGLHHVIAAHEGTENKALRLRQLQMSLLMISRDIEQAVNRPIVNASGKEEAAFIGKPTYFALTHAGYANAITHSSLQRSAYRWDENTLLRMTWLMLDQAPKAKTFERSLLDNVTAAKFEYLDGKGRFHEQWPLENLDVVSPLPRGVKINLTIKNWGNLTQVYLIAAQNQLQIQGDKDVK